MLYSFTRTVFAQSEISTVYFKRCGMLGGFPQSSRIHSKRTQPHATVEWENITKPHATK